MTEQKISLYRMGDRVMASFNGEDDIAVSIVWLRPATGLGKEVSVLSGDQELVILESLSELDDLSKKIAEAELEKNYIISKITRINSADVHMGNIYIEVGTDMGDRHFVIKNPFTNIRTVDPDGMLIRDVMGNLFSIQSLSKLDVRSRAELEKIF
jgi:hypothetical protein